MRSLGQNQTEVQYGLGSYFLIPDTRRQRGGRKKRGKRINRNKNEKKNIKIGNRKILKVP